MANAHDGQSSFAKSFKDCSTNLQENYQFYRSGQDVLRDDGLKFITDNLVVTNLKGAVNKDDYSDLKIVNAPSTPGENEVTVKIPFVGIVCHLQVMGPVEEFIKQKLCEKVVKPTYMYFMEKEAFREYVEHRHKPMTYHNADYLDYLKTIARGDRELHRLRARKNGEMKKYIDDNARVKLLPCEWTRFFKKVEKVVYRPLARDMEELKSVYQEIEQRFGKRPTGEEYVSCWKENAEKYILSKQNK